jgi:chromate transport protein ChrA
MLILALIAVLTRALQYRIVQGIMAIGLLVACVLVLSSSWVLLRPYILGPRRWRAVAFSAAALALLFVGYTPVRIVLLGAVAGFLLPPGRAAAPTAAAAR